MRALPCIAFLLVCVLAGAQAPVPGDDSYVWGEGWGRTAEEADREALSALVSKISVAFSSSFFQVEDQYAGTKGDGHYSRQSSRTTMSSSVTLPGTGGSVEKAGRRYHAWRWMRREDLDGIFADRKSRALEYEQYAVEAERKGRLDDALRYHYWAYAILSTVARPTEVRDARGRILLNAIPERMNDLLGSIRTSAGIRSGNAVRLEFRHGGKPVESLDFSFFDGSRWTPRQHVRDGAATVHYAPGAPGNVIQIRIEYAYRDEAMMDAELSDILGSADVRPLRKSYVIFRR